MRLLGMAAPWVVVAAANLAGQPVQEKTPGVPDIMEMMERLIHPPYLPPDESKTPRWPVYDTPKAARAEFRPGAIERGEADEPDIARMGADSTDGVAVKSVVFQTQLRQLEAVRLTADVKNVSSLQCVIPMSGSNPYLSARVRVFDTRGKLLPVTRFYQLDGKCMNEVGGGLNLFAGAHLDPGQSFRVDLVPNLLYDMSLPGEYWVLVEFDVHFQYGRPNGGRLGTARARPVKVRVVADPTKFGVPFQPDKDRLPGDDLSLGDAVKQADVIVAAEVRNAGSIDNRPGAKSYPEVEVRTTEFLKGQARDLRLRTVFYAVDLVRFESSPEEGEDYLFLLSRTERGYEAIKVLRKTKANRKAIADGRS